MKKDKSAIVSGAGWLLSFAEALTRGFRELGWTNEDIHALVTQEGEPTVKEIAAAVVEKFKKATRVFTIKIGGDRTLREVVLGSGYTGYDSSIFERHEGEVCLEVFDTERFYHDLERREPTRGPEREVRVEVFDIEHFDHDPTHEEIEAEYVRLGLKRPMPDHAVHFGDQQRNLPKGRYSIIFYLKDPIPDASGFRYVLRLWRDGVYRRLYWTDLDPSDRWARDCLFAGVRE